MKDKPSVPAKPQTAAVVVVPLELFSAAVQKLSEQPYKDVGNLLNQLLQLKSQDIPITA